MKNYTLIAIISLVIITLTHILYLFPRLELTEDIYLASGILQLFSYAGLTVFFIKLYQKQK